MKFIGGGWGNEQDYGYLASYNPQDQFFSTVFNLFLFIFPLLSFFILSPPFFHTFGGEGDDGARPFCVESSSPPPSLDETLNIFSDNQTSCQTIAV